MSFADLILRLGVALGGWLIFIGYGLVLSVLDQADCDPASDVRWRGTLFFAALAGTAVAGLGLGLNWRHHLRWLAVPGIALAAYALRLVLPAIAGTTMGGESLCAISSSLPAGVELAHFEATSIERAWPIAQAVVLVAGIGQGLRYWRGPSPTSEE